MTRMHTRFVALSLATALATFVTHRADAQAWRGKGRVEGRVSDPEGKPIAGADVKLRLGKAGNTGPDVKSDKKGSWAVLGLSGGEWKIDVDAPGFIPGTIVVKVSEFERAPLLDLKMERLKAAEPEAPGVAGSGYPPEVMDNVKTGNEALEKKSWKVARESYEKVAVAMPDNTSVWFALSRAYYGEGNVAKSVEALEKVTAKEPANDNAWLLMANMLLEKGQLDKGRAALDKVPAASIKDAGVYINVGVLYMNKNKATEAEDYFGRAIALEPASHLGYYYRGLARVQSQKLAEAKPDLQKVVEIAPTSTEAKEAKDLLASMK